MPKFYNRTKGPLAIELTGGRSVLVAPKKTISLPVGEPVTSSLAEMVRKGFLVLRPVDDVVEAPAAPVEAVVAPEPTPVEEPVASTSLEVTTELSEPTANTESSTSDLEVPSDSQTDLASDEISAIDTPQRRRKRSS